jgi:hypothetical protein
MGTPELDKNRYFRIFWQDGTSGIYSAKMIREGFEGSQLIRHDWMWEIRKQDIHIGAMVCLDKQPMVFYVS